MKLTRWYSASTRGNPLRIDVPHRRRVDDVPMVKFMYWSCIYSPAKWNWVRYYGPGGRLGGPTLRSALSRSCVYHSDVSLLPYNLKKISTHIIRTGKKQTKTKTKTKLVVHFRDVEYCSSWKNILKKKKRKKGKSEFEPGSLARQSGDSTILRSF